MENMKAVMITTQHRGVFFGYVPKDKDLTQKTLTDIKGARMAIYWATDKGLLELAEIGPNSNSRIGRPADIECLHDITGVFSVTKSAEDKWISA